ncbi:MAG: FkbM family methyltransferase [Planctomycetes bacterium]|nr:FkbM family methyltransferase [Planctomycetota bacterium]
MNYSLLQVPRSASELRCAIAARHRDRSDDRGHDAVARVLETCDLVVDPRDQAVAHHLLTVGFWEWWITKAIADCMRPGTTCVDLGANAGYFSALFCSLGAAAVIAVEPHPELVRRLRMTAARNGWPQLEVVPCAVADRSGKARLFVHGDDNLGGSALVPPDDPRPQGIDVPVRTLDEILGDRAPIQVMKIDCEGSEPAIWRGMQRVLANNPDMHVFAEISVNSATEPWLRDVEAAGYPLRVVADGGDLVPLPLARIHEKELWMGYFHQDSP